MSLEIQINMNIKKRAKSQVDFISGMCAGISNVLVCAPLDTARTRLQVQGLYTPKYSGIVQALSTIYKSEGVRGLYQGISVSLIAYPCSWSIYFYLYEKLKPQLNLYTNYSILSNVVSASMSGLVSAVLTNPFWLIRVRMQIQHENHIPGWKIAKDIITKEGFFSLYRGMSASLLGIIHVAIYFPLYEICKEKFYYQKQPSLIEVMFCSWLPKIVASGFSYPHEVMRARLFIYDKSFDKRFNGLFGLAKYTFSNEGFRGFYGGFCANLCRILPSTFVTIYTYEKVKYFILNLE